MIGVVFAAGCTSDDQNQDNTNTQINQTQNNSQNDDQTNDQDDDQNLEDNEQTNTQTTAPYVGNINTKKFHRSTCRYVDQMKDSNKIYFNTRQEAIDAGYTPCKVCNP